MTILCSSFCTNTSISPLLYMVISIMQKLQTKNKKMTSRRAVAPVIATLLLVAIAVVGGSIIFVFSQGFFSSAQVSGAPQIESLEIVGYDASDVGELTLHDGLCSGGTGIPPCLLATDQNGIDGLQADERVAVYLQNQSAQSVTVLELSVAGVVYTYSQGTGALPAFGLPDDPNVAAEQFYTIVENGLAAAAAETKDTITPVLNAGEEVTIMVQIKSDIQQGRDAQFKIETANGAVFVGTIIAGQQSG